MESLEQNYARAGFMTALEPGIRPALIVVDFVKAYLERDSPLYADVEDARAACLTLLSQARAARIPIVHTRLRYEPGGADGGVFFRKGPALACFEAGRYPRFAEFATGLEPLPGESEVTKQYASAFFGTALSSLLTAWQRDTVLIVGVSTSGCVRATAVDACQHGFIPVVVRDAVGDRATEPHAAALFDLQAKYAEVWDLNTAVAYLARPPVDSARVSSSV